MIFNMKILKIILRTYNNFGYLHGHTRHLIFNFIISNIFFRYQMMVRIM